MSFFLQKGQEGGPQKLLASYSLTSILLHVMEQLILETISKHVKDKSSPQGVMLDHLITFYNEMTPVVDEVVDIVCLSFCKNFDTGSHKIVMQKVMKYRLAGQPIHFFIMEGVYVQCVREAREKRQYFLGGLGVASGVLTSSR